ncbi:MAG: Bro-N domain-containing protein [Bacteroidia bacterium]|nr:Bro-N domain-containing protein [Bacteroidia bacterium]
MGNTEKMQQFEGLKIRTVWNEDEEKWYFSIVDVVRVLTDSADPKQYIKKMRLRDHELNSRWGTICTPTEMVAADGKKYMTQAASAEQIFRIIQSVPSPKAEPFKQWMAQVAAQRVDQAIDPELSIDQAIADYRRLGYSEAWITRRIKTIEIRKGLTDEWKRGGVTKEVDFAFLTDLMSKTWSGLTTREYKKLKGLTKENLRDNMTNMELLLNALAEESATQLSKERNPEGLVQNAVVAEEGAEVAKTAKEEFEKRLGHGVVTSEKAVDYIQSPEELPFSKD